MADFWLVTGDVDGKAALVVLGPSLVVFCGTDIGEGRRFRSKFIRSKLNRRDSGLALMGVSKTGVRALRNST